jgi:hypothetical protein
MRIYVRMGPKAVETGRRARRRPLDRDELAFAKTLALEVVQDHGGKPIDLATALRFLPLVVKERPDEFDAWVCRWLCRLA